MTSYESVPIHIGKGRDVSYDALMYALTHEYEYYVTFRTEEQDMYCLHPSYIIDDPKKGVEGGGSRWWKINKEYQEILEIYSKNPEEVFRIIQKNTQREIYNGLQEASKSNVTEKILEGEELCRLGEIYFEGREEFKKIMEEQKSYLRKQLS